MVFAPLQNKKRNAGVLAFVGLRTLSRHYFCEVLLPCKTAAWIFGFNTQKVVDNWGSFLSESIGSDNRSVCDALLAPFGSKKLVSSTL